MSTRKRKREHTIAKSLGITKVGCTREFLKPVQAIGTYLRTKFGKESPSWEILKPLEKLMPLLKAIAQANAEGIGYRVEVRFDPLGQNAPRTIFYFDPDSIPPSPVPTPPKKSSTPTAPANPGNQLQLPIS